MVYLRKAYLKDVVTAAEEERAVRYASLRLFLSIGLQPRPFYGQDFTDIYVLYT